MSMREMNRMHNAGNLHQGQYKKVLCVCSAGLLRSPTTAVVLSKEPYNFNTRAAGCVPDYALIKVDAVLIHWADEIVCMEDWQAETLKNQFELDDTPVKVLGIEDNHAYRDMELVELIKSGYGKTT